jgi:hypothetical protein
MQNNNTTNARQVSVIQFGVARSAEISPKFDPEIKIQQRQE